MAARYGNFKLASLDINPLPPEAIRPVTSKPDRMRASSSSIVRKHHLSTDSGLTRDVGIYPLALSAILSRLPSRIVNVTPQVEEFMKKLDLFENTTAQPETLVQQAIPSSVDAKPTKVMTRATEGGLFVKFTYGAKHGRKEIESLIQENLKQKPIRTWHTLWQPARAFLVRGTPWLEDLHRLPSKVVKVEFYPPISGEAAGELSEESLYTLFRRYGRLRDIRPQPTDSKELPRYAHLHFDNIRAAIMAKSCMHGYTVPPTEGGSKDGTVLKLVYKKKKRAGIMWDWLVNHPRLTIPLLAALLGTLAVWIFDPIRTWFIKAHVTRFFHISDLRFFRWFRSQADKSIEYLKLRRKQTEDPGLRAIWDDRSKSIEQLRTWLMETADTFIVIQGPRGSGKKELVFEQALQGRKNTLLIDCKPIQEARGDGSTIAAAAVEVGYRPIFSWMNSLSSLIDLAAQGTIGAKTGFSETLDTQLQKIWQNTSTALRNIALADRKKDDKDASLGDDEYLEAHPEKRPVVVINNFLHKAQENGLVYDKISEWAASLTTGNVAHVIFLTSDVSFSKSLGKALPDRVFRQISLGDCSPDVAKRFVINHLDASDVPESPSDSGKTPSKKSEKDAPPDLPPSQRRSDLSDLDTVITILGGRLTDLEFLARRIKSGESPEQAVHEIIGQSASEILKMYILDISSCSRSASSTAPTSATCTNDHKRWTSEEAWSLIRALANSKDEGGGIKYNEFVVQEQVEETALRALEQAELISITTTNGRPSVIKPGRPVFTAAFRQLVGDKILAARMDLVALEAGVKKETKDIEKCEAELSVIGALPFQPGELRPRARWLLGKLLGCQEKVEGMEREIKRLKGVLREGE